MKVLITGGAGFIGFHLAKFLLSKGYDIILVDNFYRGEKDSDFSQLLERKNVKFINFDLLSQKEISILEDDINFIIHLAAIIGVQNVVKKPFNVLDDNVKMLSNIIAFSKRQKNLKKFLFASTSEVYAGTLANFNLDIPTPELSPLALSDISHPRTTYMLSKIYGEAMCIHSGLPYVIFRPHNFYGPRMGMSHLIPEQLKKIFLASEGDFIDVYSLEHSRTFCYIDDAIQMIEFLMSSNKVLNDTFNLGWSFPEYKIKDIINICHSNQDKSVYLREVLDINASPLRRAPKMDKLFDMKKFKQTHLEQGVKLTREWYEKNYFCTLK